MSLEGKITDISIGDIILISNTEKNMEAAGFVIALEVDWIELSHENPYARVPGPNFFAKVPNLSRAELTRGNRLYKLASFTEYKVLKKHNLDGRSN